MKRKLSLLLLLLVCGFCASAQYQFPYGNEVRAFKHLDSVNSPKPAGILFVGSSSIRLWDDLEQRFPNAHIIKRGVGGSKLEEWVKYYTPYILLPYKPAKIFIYAGENDIAGDIPAAQVAQNFSALWQKIRVKLPAAKVYFLSIKQSPSRAKYYQAVTQANTLIKKFISSKANTYFIDVNTPLLNTTTALPDSNYFKSDYLHLLPSGYDKWAKVLTPYLNKKKPLTR